MIWNNTPGFFEIGCIAVFVIIYIIYATKAKRLSKAFGQQTQTLAIKFFLRLVYLGLILAAILGPSFGLTEIEAREVSKDVFFYVDISKSMNVQDVKPSRLEFAKNLINTIVRSQKEARISLNVFAENAYTMVPLTFDQNLLEKAILDISTDLVEEDGTNLASIFSYQKNKTDTASVSRKKVMIILTDAENFGQETLNRLSEYTIAIVGIGTQKGGLVPKKDGISQLDKTKITTYATRIGATPFFQENENNLSQALIKWINTQVTLTTKAQNVVVANNKYLYFLIPALVLLVLDIIFVSRLFQIK